MWEDGVAVARCWDGFVSPGRPQCGFSVPEVEGDQSWMDEDDGESYLLIHRVCLSLMCRRLDTTPQEFWESFFPADHLTARPRHTEWPSFTHLEIEDRQGQEFAYAIHKFGPGDNSTGKFEYWNDTDSMDECRWVLARPTVLPKLQVLPASRAPTGAASASPDAPIPPVLKVLRVDELLMHILSFLQSPRLTNPDSPSPVVHSDVLRAYAGLQRTSRAFHSLLAGHQDVYFALVRDSGWMLPACHADWAEWKEAGNPDVIEQAQWDWKTYLEAFVRLEERHVRSRWRIERMLIIFGVPTEAFSSAPGELWTVGMVGRCSILQEPEPFEWEDELPEPHEDESDE